MDSNNACCSSASSPPLQDFWTASTPNGKPRHKPKLFINAISRHAGALKLTGDDFMLFMYLLDRQGTNSSSWPSKARIAADLGWPLSSRRCKRLDAAIRRLRALGYVQVTTTSTGQGALKRSKNRYDVSPLIRGLGYQPRHEKVRAQIEAAEKAGAVLPVTIDGQTLSAMTINSDLPADAEQLAGALFTLGHRWNADHPVGVSREAVIGTGKISSKQLARLYAASKPSREVRP